MKSRKGHGQNFVGESFDVGGRASGQQRDFATGSSTPGTISSACQVTMSSCGQCEIMCWRIQNILGVVHEQMKDHRSLVCHP